MSATRSLKGAVGTGLMICGLVVVGAGGWAATTEIAGAVIAPGTIETTPRVMPVSHPEGGLVREVMVREGQKVARGEALMALDDLDTRTELAIAEGRYVELLARIQRLGAERVGADRIAWSAELVSRRQDPETAAVLDSEQNVFDDGQQTLLRSLEALQSQAVQIDAQVKGFGSRREALDRQATMMRSEVERQEKLDLKGLAIAPQIMQSRIDLSRLEGEISALDASIAEAAARKAEIEVQSLALQAERKARAAEALREAEAGFATERERVDALRRRIERAVLRAPEAGIVHRMAVRSPGAVLRPGEPAMGIVPSGADLILLARLAATDIDTVRPGQEALVRLSGLPMRTTPEVQARVLRVSADAIEDERTGQTFFEVEAEIPQSEAKTLSVQLLPGMPAEMHVILPSRSPLSYLVRPLQDSLMRTMREE